MTINYLVLNCTSVAGLIQSIYKFMYEKMSCWSLREVRDPVFQGIRSCGGYPQFV